MRTFTILVVLAAVAAMGYARPQDDAEYYDEEAEAPPPPSSTARPSILSRGRAIAPLRKPGAATKKPIEATTTTTTTTAAPAEEEEYEDEAQPQEAVSEEPTTKKYLLAGRNGVVRPFRSNDDLIAALKRRRAQTHVSTHAPPKIEEQSSAEQAAPAPKSKAKSGRTSANLNSAPRKRFSPSHGSVASQPVAQSVDAPAPAAPATPPRARAAAPPTFNRRASSRSRVQEEQLAAEDAEESRTDEQPLRPSRSSFTPRRRS